MADTKDTQNGFEIDGASLDNILAQVEQELAPVLKAEKDRLVKAKEDGDGDGDADDKGSDGPPAKEESSPPAEESSPAAPPADASGAPPAGPPASPAGPDASASPPGSPPASPGGLPADPAALAQMIAQMPIEKQKAIYLASKQSLSAALAAGSPPAGPDASAGAPPMAPPAAPAAPPMDASAPPAPPAPPASAPPADASGAPPMDPAMKNEMKPSEGNGGKSVPVKKTEKQPMVNKDNEELKALVKAQDEKIGQLTKIVGMLAGTPVRKAVTSVGVLKKTEDGKDEQKQLTKSEVTSQLTELIKGNKLSKKDRENVRKFYDQGSSDFKLIEHLFQ